VLSRGDTLKALSVYEKALDINPSYIELDDYVNRLYLQIAVKRNDKQ
jgi:hypothetical protein